MRLAITFLYATVKLPRRQHVGRMLYEYVLQYAKDQGCYDVILNVWEGNDSAHAFCEKMGMFVKEIQMEVLL